MTDFTIEELSLPETADDLDFERTIGLRNDHMVRMLGDAAGQVTATEMLPALQDMTHQRKRLLVARRGGEVVASALVAWSTEPDTRITGFEMFVDPGSRQRGIGSALLERITTGSLAEGRPVLMTGATHEAIPGSEMLAAPTGFGSVPLADPGVRFLQHHGFTLEQVYRLSRLVLPVPDEVLGGYEAEAWAKAGEDYRIVTWAGATPDQWLDDVATIFARMSTDAPTGNLEIEEEKWDAERVRQNDARRARSGRLALVAAVEHLPSGKLVAFNGVSVSEADRTRPAQQGVTLVLKEHRGHRLGMLVKVGNIRQLMAQSPTTPFILTDNAEENRPMLDVNEAVGFEAIGYEGAWQKVLD
jgi:GNAT superfamily N-acetyltransferase